jgi:hypothetical protein
MPLLKKTPIETKSHAISKLVNLGSETQLRIQLKASQRAITGRISRQVVVAIELNGFRRTLRRRDERVAIAAANSHEAFFFLG